MANNKPLTAKQYITIESSIERNAAALRNERTDEGVLPGRHPKAIARSVRARKRAEARARLAAKRQQAALDRREKTIERLSEDRAKMAIRGTVKPTAEDRAAVKAEKLEKEMEKLEKLLGSALTKKQRESLAAKAG